MIYPNYRESHNYAGCFATDRLRIISKALKDYIANDKAIEEFENEYGCTIIYDEHGNGIMDVVFHNSSNETMFMLKYNNDV